MDWSRTTATTTIYLAGTGSWSGGWDWGDAETTLITEFKLQPLPVWGWWAEFYPPTAYLAPALRIAPSAVRRPQARACRVDRNRWKRRRFVQRLRRKARA